MADEPWRASLDRALERSGRSPRHRFVQLATTGLDGRPAVRTLVFRGFLDGTSDLVFTTDLRSAKCREIQASRYAALCWWFAESREQFRFSGVVRVVGVATVDSALNQARRKVWRGLSDETRAGFTWPKPGVPRDRGVPFSTTPPDADAPPDVFALLVFQASEVDHLELDGDPQRRWRHLLAQRGGWSTREVNP